jgi:hypothetical protein
MEIVLDGKKVRLDKRAVLGAGGEATVVKHKSWAVKIYHAPTPQHAAKLRDLVSLPHRLPPAVIAPELLAFDPHGRDVIGFAMRALAPAYTVAANLAHKRFRASHAISTADVAALFQNIHQTLGALHGAGFVVGDLNDLNLLFDGDAPAFIDVDSYQFGAHPCPVGTEAFLDPAHYGADLAAVTFRPANDWYSFAVLLFKSLLLVHPYGGVHPTVKTLKARAQGRIPVFAAGVRIPKIARSPDLLSDDLMQMFARYFVEGWRGEFPAGLLHSFRGSLVTCPSCGEQYPRERGECPLCTVSLPVAPVRHRVVTDGCTVETLLAARGPVVFAKVVGGAVYAVAHEDGMAVFYEASQGEPPRRVPLFNQIPAARYDALTGHLVVAPDPASETLMVVNVAGETPQGTLQTTTRLFGGGAPVFGAGGSVVYRVAGGYLTRGEIRHGQLLERALTSVMENQTWLRVAPGGDMALGYFRTFNTQQYFLVNDAGRHEIDLPPLPPGESLKATDVLFGSSAALLVRHTRQAGVDYARLDEIGAGGEVVRSLRRKQSDAPAITTLGNQVYAAGVLLHPTDDGIVQERLHDGALRTFAATEPYIAAGDRLAGYRDGLLVVKSDRVLFLTLA